MWKRIIILFFGILLIAVGTAVCNYTRLGSVIPMVSFRYFLQFFNWLLSEIHPAVNGLSGGILLFLPGMLIITIGMSIYMNYDLVMVPYDCISFLLSERTEKMRLYCESQLMPHLRYWPCWYRGQYPLERFFWPLE